MPKSIDMERVRKVLDEHQYEIAAELGLGDNTDEAPGVRNANADPNSPMSARTGRMVSKKDLPIE